MFKWPGIPSPKASAHELADFAELQAWQRDSVSATDLYRLLGRIDENDYSYGVAEEEELPKDIAAAFHEIERRSASCSNGYPFTMDERGYVLRARRDVGYVKHITYKYLLLATRLNMSNNRVHSGVDGTVIFEKLSAEISRNYLGHRARSFVFSTAGNIGDFTARVNSLCQQLGEGGEFVNRNNALTTEQDGKLDVVVWKPFSDILPGKLIIFGQCKTGTDYRDTLTQLQPDAFGRKWLRDQPAVTPVRAFFVTEALLRSRSHNAAVDSGLLFDRCRIVDFCDGISGNILDNVATWTAAAATATGLPNPNARP
jgi:hypothetical protein